jgi:hypothetical protein
MIGLAHQNDGFAKGMCVCIGAGGIFSYGFWRFGDTNP